MCVIYCCYINRKKNTWGVGSKNRPGMQSCWKRVSDCIQCLSFFLFFFLFEFSMKSNNFLIAKLPSSNIFQLNWMRRWLLLLTFKAFVCFYHDFNSILLLPALFAIYSLTHTEKEQDAETFAKRYNSYFILLEWRIEKKTLKQMDGCHVRCKGVKRVKSGHFNGKCQKKGKTEEAKNVNKINAHEWMKIIINQILFDTKYKKVT